MKVILIILIVFLLWVFIFSPLIKMASYNKERNKQAYKMLSLYEKNLILEEDVFALADLITNFEILKDYDHASILLNACYHNGLSFVNRVDKIRNELRINAGLGALKII